MNRRVGTSYALSVGIVLFFAVALRPRDESKLKVEIRKAAAAVKNQPVVSRQARPIERR